MTSRSSTTDSAGSPPRTIEVARIRKPHGIRGEVAVEVLTDVVGRLDPGRVLLLAGVEGRTEVRVASFRPHGRGAVLRLEGCEEREAAEALRGLALEVDRSEVPPSPAGSWYHFELVGCRLADRACGELGIVEAILEDGGGHLLEVRGPAGSVHVPWVEAFIVEVDVQERRIEVDLPEGLVETCTSTS